MINQIKKNQLNIFNKKRKIQQNNHFYSKFVRILKVNTIFKIIQIEIINK